MRRPSAKPPVAKSAAARPGRRVSRAATPKPYHHGDLRRVLIDAALQLVGEGGADAVSVREAARRAQCLNRMKQMGLALMSFHDVKNKFPPGVSDELNTNAATGALITPNPPYQYTELGYIPYILSYMELGNDAVEGDPPALVVHAGERMMRLACSGKR